MLITNNNLKKQNTKSYINLVTMKYNLTNIEVGQSETLTGEDQKQTRNRVAAAACAYGKRTGKKFTTKAIEGGIILTRVA